VTDPHNPNPTDQITDDQRLQALGYAQELARRLSAFSNFAISLSIICILAGGITSFHLGLSSAGGASIGLGWPIVGAFSLIVAATMGQLAARFPTAGGLYHWAAILGGKGWGWATAWFNLAGLVTVLAAINVGTYRFAIAALGPTLGLHPNPIHPNHELLLQSIVVALITASHAAINHLGIAITAKLTDLSGWWILAVSALLAISVLICASHHDFTRLVHIENLTGSTGGHVWPQTQSIAVALLLGFLLPAYTITGFDASAHASEETIGASQSVPRAILRSVLVSVVAGWFLLSAIVVSAPNLRHAAAQGENALVSILDALLPKPLAITLFASIVFAQYLCGLATVTSASRMAFAFARDGGLPASRALRRVSPRFKVPTAAIWSVAAAAVLFTLSTPVYSTITAVCVIFLYVSYVLPTILGAITFKKRWHADPAWNLGRAYRPLAAVAALGCLGLIAIGMQPPNQSATWVVGAAVLALSLSWFAGVKNHFPGPPVIPIDDNNNSGAQSS
jgi:amino acid transporter